MEQPKQEPAPYGMLEQEVKDQRNKMSAWPLLRAGTEKTVLGEYRDDGLQGEGRLGGWTKLLGGTNSSDEGWGRGFKEKPATPGCAFPSHTQLHRASVVEAVM